MISAFSSSPPAQLAQSRNAEPITNYAQVAVAARSASPGGTHRCNASCTTCGFRALGSGGIKAQLANEHFQNRTIVYSCL